MLIQNQSSVNVLDDAPKASALLNPLRLQILERLREPDSASGLSRKLDIPRQKINYHLRELEKHGMIEQLEERRKGNCVERIVRATARTFMISPEALGSLAADTEQTQDRFSSSYLVATAARIIRDLAILRPKAKEAGKRLPTFTLQTEVRVASPAALNAFAEALSNAVAQLVTKYHDEQAPQGRKFNFMIGAYPAITKKLQNERKQTEEK